jgi:hypothetical protein
MRFLAWFLALASVVNSPARTAVIAPTTGGVCRGQVRLTPGGLLLVDSKTELRKEFPAGQIRWAAFETTAGRDPEDEELRAAEPWQEADIGRVTVRSASQYAHGEYTVRSSGLGIQGSADSVQFLYRTLEGDGGVVARVVSTHRTHPSAGAGVMIRNGLGPDSALVALVYSPDQGLLLKTRAEPGAPITVRVIGHESAPVWLTLRRTAGEVRAYFSPHGLRWSQGGSAPVALGRKSLGGVAATSGREWAVNSALFDHLAVGRQLDNPYYPPRAELVSGSIVVGESISGGLDHVDVRWGMSANLLPLRAVARVFFQWTSPEWLSRVPQDINGAWLSGGAFVEGDLRSIDQGCLRLSSALYGTKTWDAPSEVVMVSLHKPAAVTTPFEVVTTSGSLWRAETLEFGENEVVLREPVLGRVRIPLHELSSIVQR